MRQLRKLNHLLCKHPLKVRHLRDCATGRQHVGQVVDRPHGQPGDVGGTSLGLRQRQEDRRGSGNEHENVGAPRDSTSGENFSKPFKAITLYLCTLAACHVTTQISTIIDDATRPIYWKLFMCIIA
jgi:hypothetical protein